MKNLPAGQGEQAVAPAEGAYVPFPHASGAVIPFTGHWCPLSQLVQEEAADPEYVPARHWVGLEVVGPGHENPAGQSLHKVAPALLYLVAPQFVSVVDEQKRPAEHCVQLTAPAAL